MRTPATSFDDIPGDVPIGTIPSDADLNSLAENAIEAANDLQESCLTVDSIWRDLSGLTETYRTFVGRETVIDKLQSARHEARCGRFERTKDHPRLVPAGPNCSWIDVDVHFPFTKGNVGALAKGTVSAVVESDGVLRIWLVRTWLDYFEGHESPDFPRSSQQNGHVTNSLNTNGHDAQTTTEPDVVYDVAIVGGGQAGLSVAGRCHALGLKYILLEKCQSLGDVWDTRYASLRWHTPKDYGNLPFGRMFSDDIPELVPTKDIAAAHKAWAVKYQINCQTDCDVEKATFEGGKWTISAKAGGQSRAFKASNLVLSIGPGITSPVTPAWATPEAIKLSGFNGTAVHAKDYQSCKDWVGKGARGVTVGTANTGHDIAEDMANAGMKTTMLQRGATMVMPGEWLAAAEGAHYNAKIENHVADRQQFTMPLKVVRQLINKNTHAGVEAHPERFDALEKAGFKLDRFGDLYTNIFTRFGVHYIDTGASARIASGEIAMETAPVRGLCCNGIQLEDGRVLECDLIVLATGYGHDFRADAAKIVGHDVADRMDDFHGVDREGEIRGYAKYAGVPHLYYHGGDTRASRFMSRFVALQIQAEKLGAVSLE